MEVVRNNYKAEVTDVFSGDDLTVLVDLGAERLYQKNRIRLRGVDTPNAVGQSGDTEAGRLRNKVYTMTKGKELQITVHTRTTTGWICTVEIKTADGLVNLNDFLINQGYKFTRKEA